jgi:large subunit ribosomal protein L29
MKIQEIKELTVEELNKRGRELRSEALSLRVQKAAGQLENPARIPKIRREVAQIETVLTERRNKAKAGS